MQQKLREGPEPVVLSEDVGLESFDSIISSCVQQVEQQLLRAAAAMQAPVNADLQPFAVSTIGQLACSKRGRAPLMKKV